MLNAAKVKTVQQISFKENLIFILQINRSTFASVQKFTRGIDKAGDHVDLVLLDSDNAPLSYKKSSEGWEMALQVNVLSISLMRLLLIFNNRATAQFR